MEMGTGWEGDSDVEWQTQARVEILEGQIGALEARLQAIYLYKRYHRIVAALPEVDIDIMFQLTKAVENSTTRLEETISTATEALLYTMRAVRDVAMSLVSYAAIPYRAKNKYGSFTKLAENMQYYIECHPARFWKWK